MQHHQARPQHMRTHHMHQQAAPMAHMTMNLGPPQPQQQNVVAAHQQPQPHHMSNGGATLAMQPPPPNQQAQQQQQPHTKSGYMPTQALNRLSHHLPHQQPQQHHLMPAQQQQQLHRINPQAIHTTTQMQKIRQQHQHQLVNNNSTNNNNNTNSNTNGNHHNNSHHVQQQHMGVHQQHPRNIHHPIQHVPHIKHHQQQQQQHQQQQHSHGANIGVVKHQQQQHHHHQQQPQQQQQEHQQKHVAHLPHNTHKAQPTAVNVQQQQTPIQHPQQHHHKYPNGSKSSYKNNNQNAAASGANTSMPKSILQNPNRTNNSKQQNIVPEMSSDVKTKNVSTKSNDAGKTPIVSAQHAIATTLNEAPATAKPDAICEVFAQDDKENISSTANERDELSGDNSCGDDAHSVSGTKEKTPMCLVNELARYNKITHQYRLTNEKGPAHCKRFTVTLKLGDEEYCAEGYKIKKAQHLAASEAIEKTKYKHPIPKTIRRTDDGGNSRAKITPTVELNALAMKLGQQTYYLFDPMQQPPPETMMGPPPPPQGADMLYRPPIGHGPPPPLPPHAGAPMMAPPPPHHMLDSNPYMRRLPGPYQRFNGYRGGGGGGFQNPNKFMPRYPLNPPPMALNGVVPGGMPPHPHVHGAYPPPTVPSKITLIVGKQKFIGTGRTLQAAKHDAAANALQVLKTQAATKLNEILNRSIEESDSKSPISLVHEIGIKRNLPVNFKVLREEGPAHMKNFITACTVGNIVTEGDGNGKKISKKRAAEKMLEELKKLPPLTPTKSPVKRLRVKPGAAGGGTGVGVAGIVGGSERKKRSGGASIKEKGDDGDNENPISKLIVLLQSRKEAEPVYDLISKNGNETTGRREFIIEVSAAGKVARGMGNNMKAAKRNAAQNLLEIICSESVSIASMPQPTEIKEMTAEQKLKEAIKVKKILPKLDVAANDIKKVNAEATPASTTATAAATASNPLPLVTTPAGQVPGILILRQNKKKEAKKAATAVADDAKSDASKAANSAQISLLSSAESVSTAAETKTVSITTTTETTTAPKPSEAQSETTPVLNASTTSTSSTSSSSSGLRMKHQLLYLAQLLDFDVDFSDYPKGNHNEFLTIVTLSTTPAQICHGTGANSEESQNDAAKNALRILSELGLNNVKAK